MSIMPLSEFSGEKNESRENRVMRWRERYYRQESCIAALKAQRDELLAALQMALADHMTESYLHPLRDGTVEAIRCAIANAEATP